MRHMHRSMTLPRRWKPHGHGRWFMDWRLLMLDGQIPVNDALIDQVIDPDV